MTTGNVFLAFDIGCIECGSSSAVIGTFATREQAQAACDAWEALGWRDGQHFYEVFDLRSAVGLPAATPEEER